MTLSWWPNVVLWCRCKIHKQRGRFIHCHGNPKPSLLAISHGSSWLGPLTFKNCRNHYKFETSGNVRQFADWRPTILEWHLNLAIIRRCVLRACEITHIFVCTKQISAIIIRRAVYVNAQSSVAPVALRPRFVRSRTTERKFVTDC